MLSFMKQVSRLVDLVALAAVGGTLTGVFVTFLVFAHVPTPSEWPPLIGASWRVSPEQSRETLTTSERVDTEEAGAPPAAPY
jgi:hypothetical protein